MPDMDPVSCTLDFTRWGPEDLVVFDGGLKQFRALLLDGDGGDGFLQFGLAVSSPLGHGWLVVVTDRRDLPEIVLAAAASDKVALQVVKYIASMMDGLMELTGGEKLE